MEKGGEDTERWFSGAIASCAKPRNLAGHGVRSGVRSGKAVDFLRQAGFRKVKNMVGGILAWSDKVDPSVPKY